MGELKDVDPLVATTMPSIIMSDVETGGFGAGASKKKKGKRTTLVAPPHRLSVRNDGTIEITVSFGSEPADPHVILTEVWVHIRAEGVGFNLALPRQPLWNAPMKASRLSTPGSFLFEIQAKSDVGALENYNAWAN